MWNLDIEFLKVSMALNRVKASHNDIIVLDLSGQLIQMSLEVLKPFTRCCLIYS